MKTLLVTGGAGYLGSVLCRRLVGRGYRVRCLDGLSFGRRPVADLEGDLFRLHAGDIRSDEDLLALLEGAGAVVHLAALADDPSCDLDPDLSDEINVDATLRLARRARERGVARFIFASTCGVYGAAGEDLRSEGDPPCPASRYAESKLRAEGGLLALKDPSFEPVILRQGTLFGASPRMRFDIPVNLMTLHGSTEGKVFVRGGGRQWRPFVHVEDASEAFIAAVEADPDEVSGQVLNVVSEEQNLRIADLATLVAEVLGGIEVEAVPGEADRRSYRVRSDRVAAALGWRPERTVGEGIDEIAHALRDGSIPDPQDDIYYNVRTLKRLRELPVREGGQAIRRRYLPFCVPSIGEEEEREVIETLRSGWLTTGARTARFESMLKDYTGARDVVAVNSCTAALHLSLVGAGIGPGDEVITSPVTWPATANVVIHVGAKPVFVDIERDTFNLRADAIGAAVTHRTRAIIPVHMAGQPCDLDPIHALAKRHGLTVIEDGAHALGAEYRGRRIGSLSDFACFSFYPIKNITTGEGGAVAANDPEAAGRIRVLSLHGVTRDAWARYGPQAGGHWECVAAGFKYNMPDLLAAIGIHQIGRLDGFIETRAAMARLYDELLADTPEVIRPRVVDGVRHAHHLYIIMLEPERLKITRDDLVAHLRDENIGTGIHFRSLHVQPYYRDRYGYKPEDFPNAAFTSERIVSLPLYPSMCREDVVRVADAVKKIVRYYRR